MRAKDLVLAWVWACFAMWSLPAAAAGFSADIRGYDFEGMGWAVLVSLTGGSFATLLSLMRDELVLLHAWREFRKDAVVACIAGVVAYVTLVAFTSTNMVGVPGPLKVAVLFFAGWARMAFFAWVERTGKSVADKGARWVEDKIPTKGE